jgi:hypothetical protein
MGSDYYYQATTEITHYDAFRCACGYASGVVVTAEGLGAGRIGDAGNLRDAERTEGAAAQATQAASENARDEAKTLVAFAQCPQCGQRNRAAIGARRNRAIKVFVVLGVLAFGVPAAFVALDMLAVAFGLGVLSVILYPLILGIWLWMWLGNYRNADKLVRFNGIAPAAPAPARLPLPG